MIAPERSFLKPRRLRHSAGFTLVELMVAITGGLIVAIFVFGMAKEGSRFYQRESRMAEATLSAMNGFSRLQGELSRAGFLSSPNVRSDPRLCGTVDNTWPAALGALASVQFSPDGSILDPANSLLRANGRTPDHLVLTGSFGTAEEFPIWGVIQSTSGAGYTVLLQQQIGPLARMGFMAQNAAAQNTTLTRLFPQGRALRVVDQAGKIHFGAITAVANTADGPQVSLSATPTLNLRGLSSTTCGLRGNETGSASVVNIVHYQLRDVQRMPASSVDRIAHNALFTAPPGSELATWDSGRTELIREELDVSGAPIAGTMEVLAEYAVDLEFGLTAVSSMASGVPGPLQALDFSQDALIAQYAGSVAGSSATTPQRIRGVRVRMSVRSQVPDRDATLAGSPGGLVPVGFYRMGLGAGATLPFARVRTLQADVSLRNHEGVRW